MNDHIQRRLRASFRVEIIVRQEQKIIFETVSKNISLNGVFLETGHKLPLNSHCRLEITLMPSNPPIVLHIESHVVRHADDGMAVTFTNMDLETYNHLKNIILYNTDETDEFITQCLEKPGFK